ncbi:PREDICTED: uncharacterized protein LOC108776744 [Cyphomyrmex costatus]|uniref:uncharacterized protein LOC108776744 n=1 Tax=Cyphomyrmex costatus TaxID=456900 RepID=UPI0008521F50|nr:PREDICTED: uncharacterized protein LOC108776744 [Cyphomyrmex costatus]
MDEMQIKIETWTELMQLEKLQDVSEDIQMTVRVRPNGKLNDGLFKLLLRLCCIADKWNKCNERNCETGKSIAKLAKLLCSLLIKVSDDTNFVKAVFKIVKCLISFNLYEDAAEICCYLQPGTLYNPRDNTMNIVMKVLSLWRVLVNNLYVTFTNEPSNIENYNKLKSVIKYEMKMMQIAYKNYTRHLIMEISMYLDRIAAIGKNTKYFDDFCKYILDYLLGLELYLDKDEKHLIYRYLLRIMCHVICKTINTTDIESAIETLDELSSYFDTLVAEDEECYQSFQQFQSLCKNLLVPIKNLTRDSAKNIHTDEFYVKQASIKCKWCQNKLCTVKRDLYNAIVMRCRFISLLCKFPVKTLPVEMCVLSRKILEQNVESIIYEMKETGCKRWTQSWNICRNIIYNIGVLSEHVYEESVHLKAMTVCALNALLTCNQSNTIAFRTWISIKKNVSEDIANLTMLECLTNDKDEIKNKLGYSFDISKNDSTELCLSEARNLLEEQIIFTNGVAAVLKKLRKLQPSNQYAHTMQLLGYYFLGFTPHDSSILKYHEQAICDLKQDKSDSVAILCLEANLSLFMFVEELHIMNKQTEIEMENTKFALCAPKLRELTEVKSPNVVPAYTMINVKKDTSLMLCLQKCLQKWKQLFKWHFKEIVKDWEPSLILRMLVTAGEYARLYRYEDCEAEVWTLAYQLASEMNDYTIIYITSRCISLRQVNYDWITTAKEHIIKHRNSTDENVIGTIAIFWISLADLYFEYEKYDDAKQLLIEARSLSGISFLANRTVYLLSLDVIIRNSHIYIDNMQHENYGSCIVESIAAIRTLNQDLLSNKWTNRSTYLFSYDTLFTVAVNLSIRINNLLSFRGICPDLVLLLKSAQSLSAMLRTAELLKSLCYIDLSRLQLEDCEVKLQGLEHMLNVETFQLSIEVSTRSVETSFVHLAVTPTKIVDPVRDAPQYGASPVLGNKVFDPPKFTSHINCDCYKCSNVSYQYLVFATTYIRAQLYALQNHTMAALDHFHGAFQLRQRLFKEEESVLPENWPRDEIMRFSWQTRFYMIDYILLLIDFCYFLKAKVTSRQEDVFNIANLAVNICDKYKLQCHPIYITVKELAFDNEFQPVLESSDLKFTVPQPHEINTTDHAKIPIDPSVCVTPSIQNHRAKKPLSLRRRKSPIALKITKINMIWSDDEDDDSVSPPPPPPPVTYSNRKSKSRINLVKRKILEKDIEDDLANLNIEDSKETKSENMNKDSTQRKTINDIITEVASLVPDISNILVNLVDKSDLPATKENVDKLIENVENLKIKSKIRRTIVKDTKQPMTTDYNKNISKAIELLKDPTINGKTNENVDSSTSIKPEKADKLQDQKILEIPKENKFFKSRTPKERIGKADTPLTNKNKTVRNKSSQLPVNNEEHSTRTTRSSIRRSQKEKSS